MAKTPSAPTALAVLTGVNLLNYVDRYVMSAVLPRVQDDLHLSNFMGGSLFTVFLIGYFATSPIFGILADRAATGGRKRLLMLGVSIWIRLKLNESPVFLRMKAEGRGSKRPLTEAFGQWVNLRNPT